MRSIRCKLGDAEMSAHIFTELHVGFPNPMGR